ncbi:hypothetical protein O3P69_006400 [Scylla paramamosain]|uniref:Uncharacterized protein n=1 Tax=Scylla paramamosain TaxID=85552 RepID=A0AAW0U443_SCYPA
MGVPHSFGRWRSALQSVSQDSSSEQSSVWNEGTCNKISRSDGENMIDNCSSVTKLHGNQRRGPLIPLRDVNNSIEPTEGVQVLGTQSAKKQYGYKSITSFRKSHQRRSCAPRFMNTGSESPWATNATANEGYKNDKTNNLYSSATKFPVSQGEDCENVPEEPAVPKFTSRFQSRLRRRSSLLKCEGDAETKITENCSESTNATANEGYKSDRTNNLYSSATKFPMSQGDDCENVPEEPAVPKFTSRFQSRLRRRSSLLMCEGDLKTKIQDNVIENCSESKDKSRNEHKTILEDEQEEADVISSHFKSSKVRMDNQEEPASEKESEQKSRFLVGEGRRRLSGAKGRRSLLEFARQRALVSQSSVERVTASGGSEIAPSGQRPVCRSRFSQWMPNGSLGKISQQKDLPVTNKAEGNKLQDCRKMLAFESGDEGEDSEDQTAPLSMLVQTPIMNRASVLQNPRDQKQQKKVCEPIIKKSLLDNGVKTSRFRRKSIVIRQQPEDNSASSHQNMELKDKTTARRLEMKQKKLMESFATSISPLKRLKAMFSENHVEEGEVKESPQQDKAEGESGACESAVATQESHCSLDQSGTEWVSPKAPLDIRNHQIQWRRRQQDNRLTRTFQESSIKEEEFAEPYQGDTSPFTILVGDCERPSLAPMTPHSRKHVGMLKLSLKEQLEQLYNN